MSASDSLFDRWIARPRHRWLGWAICLGFLGLPIVLTSIESGLAGAAAQPGFRGLLIAPAVITYIFLVSPALTKTADQVLISLRLLLDLDEQEFRALVEDNTRYRPGQERLVIAIGAAAGAIQVLASNPGVPNSWQEVYWLLSTSGLYGLLGWVIFESLAGTRLIAAIHRAVRRVDPLDPAPFDAVGRQSPLTALVFIGGISLSLLLVADQPETLRRLEFWAVYVPLAMITVAVFFLNMRPTHQVLRRAKQTELEAAMRQVNRSYRQLLSFLEQDRPTGNRAAEVDALVAYERRLQAARTWPYDTAMLPTLGLSVLVPLATVVLRSAFAMIFG